MANKLSKSGTGQSKKTTNLYFRNRLKVAKIRIKESEFQEKS